MKLDLAEFRSPIGTIVLAARERALCALVFAEGWPRMRARLERRFGDVTFHPADDPARARTALAAYFAGDIGALEGVAVDGGGTPFQRLVWDALRRIAPGASVSYQTLAGTIGRPAAVRAVGAANGANPVGLVVPCHRVIGADGSLTGYAGGVERKRWLLAHEAAVVSRRVSA
jgi:methylated-DNA-[protein]-cysteine S-methyltransferase